MGISRRFAFILLSFLLTLVSIAFRHVIALSFRGGGEGGERERESFFVISQRVSETMDSLYPFTAERRKCICDIFPFALRMA